MIGILALLMFGFAYDAISETFQMISYYPSPMGMYKRLTTAHKTVLARDDGNVGIGQANPAAKLDVLGDVILGGPTTIAGAARLKKSLQVDGSAAFSTDLSVGRNLMLGSGGTCTKTIKGALAYRDSAIQFCDGTKWVPLGEGKAELVETIIDGTRCPAGSSIIDRHYGPKACSNRCRRGCSVGTSWTTPLRCSFTDGMFRGSCCSGPACERNRITCTAGLTKVKCLGPKP